MHFVCLYHSMIFGSMLFVDENVAFNNDISYYLHNIHLSPFLSSGKAERIFDIKFAIFFSLDLKSLLSFPIDSVATHKIMDRPAKLWSSSILRLPANIIL